MNNTHSSINDLKPGTVTVIGAPSDENSSFLPGAALAPARIGELVHPSATNLSAENSVHLGTDPRRRALMDITATTAAKLLKETLACMIETNDPGVVL